MFDLDNDWQMIQIYNISFNIWICVCTVLYFISINMICLCVLHVFHCTSFQVLLTLRLRNAKILQDIDTVSLMFKMRNFTAVFRWCFFLGGFRYFSCSTIPNLTDICSNGFKPTISFLCWFLFAGRYFFGNDPSSRSFSVSRCLEPLEKQCAVPRIKDREPFKPMHGCYAIHFLSIFMAHCSTILRM